MVDSVLFIGTVIIGITQAIRFLSPKVHGVLTIVVAALVGLVVALVDTEIGIADISVAQGILTGLGSAGVVATAAAAGGATTRPEVEGR